jgi:hypothetical protein
LKEREKSVRERYSIRILCDQFVGSFVSGQINWVYIVIIIIIQLIPLSLVLTIYGLF